MTARHAPLMSNEPDEMRGPSERGTVGVSVADLARQLRVDSVRAAAAAGSGHPTSSMSAADLLAMLVSNHLRYDHSRPDLPANDHLIFSKGHASPLLYAVFKAIGAIDDDELLTFRKLGSRLQGHPTRCCFGSMSPPARWAKDFRLPPASQWRPSWSSCRTACGCFAATARWPKARCGRPSNTVDRRSLRPPPG